MDSYKLATFGEPVDMNKPSHFPGNDAIERPEYERQRTVAIIEDERDIVDVYTKFCFMNCLKVAFVAYDGSEALREFGRRARPDVLLIDHRMPNMTGLEAMRRMLELDPDAKFIVLSADDEIKDDALRAGARAFLKKPASLYEISLAITRVLNET
ncbi:Response regulator [Methanocella conradii HZ254]|uniref:Response regulator n=1 Tax=Methanocella conradii (strain DSM 24694 / JCM 17849 / CGMCC 1.5162 / HZ254) TaxID=1041930 RepID=H8I7S7_METCZ|nr:response regulator transcription factor [Methanocella conradii]AFC99912.1 Response regulator [Methanocella conradii HZ254]MDI6897259.1 response regulator transcription factor [Methanocella conradii]